MEIFGRGEMMAMKRMRKSVAKGGENR